MTAPQAQCTSMFIDYDGTTGFINFKTDHVWQRDENRQPVGQCIGCGAYPVIGVSKHCTCREAALEKLPKYKIQFTRGEQTVTEIRPDFRGHVSILSYKTNHVWRKNTNQGCLGCNITQEQALTNQQCPNRAGAVAQLPRKAFHYTVVG